MLNYQDAFGHIAGTKNPVLPGFLSAQETY